MKKKRTSLDSFFDAEKTLGSKKEIESEKVIATRSLTQASHRSHVKQQTVYLPLPVYEQLRKLAFEERQKMHTYFMKGLDLIFKKKGLPSIKELIDKEK